MLLLKAMKQMARSLSGDPQAANAAAPTPERQKLRDILLRDLFDAKAYILDEGTADLCDSLVGDIQSTQTLMERTAMPYARVWIEYDRAKLLRNREAHRGYTIKRNSASPLDPDSYIMGFLFCMEEGSTHVYTFRDRGLALFEPFVSLEFRTDDTGHVDFSSHEIYNLDHERTEMTRDSMWDESQFIAQDLHIAFVFFALAGVSSSGLDTVPKQARTSLDAIRKKMPRKIDRRQAPDIQTVRLSEIGKIHVSAVENDRATKAGGGRKRASPRRHPVRGTLFERNGKIIWRPPHMRGKDYAAPSLVKVRDDITPRGKAPKLPD